MINTIYATCGYDSKVDKSVVNNHSVTGKQAWSNFVTFVENSAKANYKFIGDGMSKAFSELENLVNTATEKGISMTQDLYDMLKSVFADQIKYNSVSVPVGNQFNDSDIDGYLSFIASICGTSVSSVINYGISVGHFLNIVKTRDGRIFIFTIPDIIVGTGEGGYDVISSVDGSKSFGYGTGVSLCFNGTYKLANRYSMPSDSWIVKNGIVVNNGVISAQVSAGACPQEVPEVAPWRKSVDIPDEWRVINPNETPEQNPDDKPEVLPVIIPIHPTKPDTKPDTETTENPDTETTENPDKDKDPDKKKNPVVNPIINPDTGNVIDPNTGWDIDPSTGKLINPNTGELVDPDMSNPSSLANKFGDITKLFPFCIPFDLVRLIKGMSAEKEPPVFHFEHKFKTIDYTFVVDVDLSDYDKYIKLFRYGMQIFYVLALMFLTAKISTYFA